MMMTTSRTGRQLQRYNEGRRQVVGCIPYRYNNDLDQLEVLLISSQKKKDGRMLFPKGGWETDESITEAAARETFEEAGIRGTLECDLGSWMFKSKRYGTLYEGSMFSLFVEEELDFWPEKDVRTRKWMSLEKAKQVCQHWWMNEAMDKLVDLHDSRSKNDRDCSLQLCEYPKKHTYSSVKENMCSVRTGMKQIEGHA